MSPEGKKASISNGQLHHAQQHHAPKLLNRPSNNSNQGEFFKLSRENQNKLNSLTMPLQPTQPRVVKKNVYATANMHLSNKTLQNKFGKFASPILHPITCQHQHSFFPYIFDSLNKSHKASITPKTTKRLTSLKRND